MKINALVSLVLSVSNVAAVKFISGPDGWAQAMGFNTTEQTWEDVEQPRTVLRLLAPKRQEMKARAANIPGSKSVKIRYGPYTIPAPRVAGGEGMVWNSPTPSIDKPCSGKCMIIGMNAGLEYPEGGDANTDTKLWLHHMVLFAIGTNAWDATCTVFGLPHMIVGSLPASSERIFSSGNERTMVLFNPPNPTGAAVGKVGYPLLAADRLGLIADLMNMNSAAKQVYMTLYYDYVEGHPADYAEIKPVWFDVAQCGTSEVGGGTAGSSFKIQSTPWIANFEGEAMAVGGHIHDGGTSLDILANNEVACTSAAYYGSGEVAKGRAEIIKAGGVPNASLLVQSSMSAAMPAAGAKSGGGAAAGGHDHAGGQHIVAMSVCGPMTTHVGSPSNTMKVTKVSKGQSWFVRAHYDYKKFTGMKNNQGGMDNVMGIAIMFVKTAKKMRVT